MSKNIIIYSGLILALFSSCKKEASTVTTTTDVAGEVSLTNANGSAKAVNFFLNGTQVSLASSVAVNGTITGTYIGLGNTTSNTISVKDATVTTTEYFSGSIATAPGKAYTFIVYDTLIAGKFKGILLSSDVIIPTNVLTSANVRWLNLSPKSPDLELWMVRSVGTVATDSVNLGAQPYLGSVAAPDATTLSKFTSIRSSEVAGSIAAGSAASTYVIKLKVSGTGALVSSSAVTNIIPGRNYTIFARGTYPASIVTLLLNN